MTTAAATLTQSTEPPRKDLKVRPFGLTRITPLDDTATVFPLDQLRYDPALQLNVDDEGTPVVDTPLMPLMATHQDTRHDNQWFTDKD